MKCVGLAVVLLVWLVAPARADFQEGVAAYERGDYAVAFREFKPLAESGHTDAQFYLGEMYSSGEGVPQNFAAAEEWYLRSAEGGHEPAQFMLGVTYLFGPGNIQKNPSAAAQWFQIVAERSREGGWAHPAMQLLGGMYETGEGVSQDYREALKWYKIAARAKDLPGMTRFFWVSEFSVASAQYKVGLMYADGKGVPPDYNEAAKWFRKAAQQGLPHAQFSLGIAYNMSKGVPQDFAEAAVWFRRAAAQDFALAQYNLGAMFANGTGVKRDYVAAHMWTNLAASKLPPGGERDVAIKALETLAGLMTSEQIAQAQRMAREWRPDKSYYAPPPGLPSLN